MAATNNHRLLIGLVLFIIYGSLYPFDFTTDLQDPQDISALFHIDGSSPRWGDVISNILLFLPFGFLGMSATSQNSSMGRRFVSMLLMGAALAFGLQWAQVYLPTRVPSLLDVFLNILGVVGGGLAFLPFRTMIWPSIPAFSRLELLAGGLIATWALDSLWPLIPGTDFHSLKVGLKPLLLHPPALQFKLAKTILIWMIILHLWEFVQKKPPGWGPQMMAVATMWILEILMEGNALEWEEILGAVLGLALWNYWLHHQRLRREILAGLLIALLIWKGLTPFIWRSSPVPFHWMPFGVFIVGDPLYQISVILEKLFLYGSLAWLLIESKTSMAWVHLLGVGPLILIESAQRYTMNHTPEITDPLLGLLLVRFLYLEFYPLNAKTAWINPPPSSHEKS